MHNFDLININFLRTFIFPFKKIKKICMISFCQLQFSSQSFNFISKGQKSSIVSLFSLQLKLRNNNNKLF